MNEEQEKVWNILKTPFKSQRDIMAEMKDEIAQTIRKEIDNEVIAAILKAHNVVR